MMPRCRRGYFTASRHIYDVSIPTWHMPVLTGAGQTMFHFGRAICGASTCNDFFTGALQASSRVAVASSDFVKARLKWPVYLVTYSCNNSHGSSPASLFYSRNRVVVVVVTCRIQQASQKCPARLRDVSGLWRGGRRQQLHHHAGLITIHIVCVASRSNVCTCVRA